MRIPRQAPALRTPDQETSAPFRPINLCHRSRHAWSDRFPPKPDSEKAPPPQPDAVPQLLRTLEGDGTPIVGPGTDLITLTIGGNDFGFGPVLEKCALSDDCRRERITSGDPRTVCETYLGPNRCCALGVSPSTGCPPPIGSSTRTALNDLATRLSQTYAKVRERGPHAELIVAGYPHVVPEAPSGCRALTTHFPWLPDVPHPRPAPTRRELSDPGPLPPASFVLDRNRVIERCHCQGAARNPYAPGTTGRACGGSDSGAITRKTLAAG